ncbi:hypothetical protein [Bosea sp. 685]|uniref:hypothetical protein n=1 Tax=Bosea sp. 685 TaxID=3080057 RepID=UPI0028932BCA|nr:hypothetical protein [Bosea sp. 685]WNJ93034.1 hypothetical protein RMR04_12390 [Bosea sp. 685]
MAQSASHYLTHYDIAVHRVMAVRGKNEILGQTPNVCRFCSRTVPAVTFCKEAHAVPELAGNGTLISLYECDECNARFAKFEDDLGKMTLLERSAGQVLGKRGVPSVTTGQKSRIDMGTSGFLIQEHEGDPIAAIDQDKKTLTVTIAPQAYRPLGAYKALVKIALTLMAEGDLAKVPEAVQWLRENDLATSQVTDCTGYSCVRGWTPGPLPIAQTTVMLLRRKPSFQAGPAYVMLLAFGNMSFQIVIPAPQEDAIIVGKPITIWPIPVFAFLEADRARGPTRFWLRSLASPAPEKGAPSIVFNFESIVEVPPGASAA